MGRSFRVSGGWVLLGLACAAGCGCQALHRPEPAMGPKAETASAELRHPRGEPGWAVPPAPPAPQDRPAGREVTEAKVSAAQEYRFQMDLAEVHALAGDPESALMAYQVALAACGRSTGSHRLTAEDRARVHHKMARVFDRAGRFPEAELAYREGLKLTPRNPKIQNDLGYSYYLQGRWAEALVALKIAEGLPGVDLRRATTNRALVLAASGRPDEAVATLSPVVGEALAHAEVGFVLAARGDVSAARRHYLAALAQQPGHPLFLRALARLDGPPDAAVPAQVIEVRRDDHLLRTAAPTGPPPPVARAATLR